MLDHHHSPSPSSSNSISALSLQEEEPFGGGDDDVVVEEERNAEHVEYVGERWFNTDAVLLHGGKSLGVQSDQSCDA